MSQRQYIVIDSAKLFWAFGHMLKGKKVKTLLN